MKRRPLKSDGSSFCPGGELDPYADPAAERGAHAPPDRPVLAGEDRPQV